MAIITGLLVLMMVSIGNGLECLFCMDANENLDHCQPIQCLSYEECYFERTIDRNTLKLLHNAGCRAKTLCQYLKGLPVGRRNNILTSTPVEYRKCSDCCDTPPTQHGPCNAFLCNQNSTVTHG